jgi:hypothetical protein
MNDSHAEKDALLPEDGPPDDIYWKVVPIWCEQSHDDLAERLGEEFGCGYAAGFQEGIVMAMLRPEWAQGLYLRLRQYYLTTHTPADLRDWERCADETTRALPLSNPDFVSESRETKLALELLDQIDPPKGKGK